MQAIGRDCTYTALKAVIIAQQYLAEEGIAIATQPYAHRVEIDGRVLQAVLLPVAVLPAGAPPQLLDTTPSEIPATPVA